MAIIFCSGKEEVELRSNSALEDGDSVKSFEWVEERSLGSLLWSTISNGGWRVSGGENQGEYRGSWYGEVFGRKWGSVSVISGI